MSNIRDAKKVMIGVGDAMKAGDVVKVQRILNDHVRGPTKEAKGYIQGVWMVSRRYCTDDNYHHPVLTVNNMGDWHCYRLDDPN